MVLNRCYRKRNRMKGRALFRSLHDSYRFETIATHVETRTR